MSKIPVVVLPFDALGSAGTGRGAMVLSDVLREAVDDTKLEKRVTRPGKFARLLYFIESRFDTVESLASWRVDAAEVAADHSIRWDFSLWLGGNHLSVLPLLEELSPTDLVIQLDAHLDCYDLADSTVELNHGNFLQALKPKKRPRIAHIGNRDLFLTAKDVKPHVDVVIPIDRVVADFDHVKAQLLELIGKAKRVWLDVDADVLDPAFAPAVHVQSPCGLTPQQLLAVLLLIPKEKFFGLSISEYDPGRDDGDRTLNLLGWFLERALLHAVGG